MKNLTRSIVRNTAKAILSLRILVIRLTIVLAILAIILLRKLMWPIRLLNQGLEMSGRWTLGKWRTTM